MILNILATLITLAMSGSLYILYDILDTQVDHRYSGSKFPVITIDLIITGVILLAIWL